MRLSSNSFLALGMGATFALTLVQGCADETEEDDATSSSSSGVPTTSSSGMMTTSSGMGGMTASSSSSSSSSSSAGGMAGAGGSGGMMASGGMGGMMASGGMGGMMASGGMGGMMAAGGMGGMGGMGGSGGAGMAPNGLLITEIMYNPDSNEDWEWIEVHNGTNLAINMAGWVLDDGNNNQLAQPNIAAGTVPAGGTAVLYNADVMTDWATGWPGVAVSIPVTNWESLNNGGDKVGLWDSYAMYSVANENVDHNLAVVTVDYDDAAMWPADDGLASIYLKALNLDPAMGASWELSINGTANAFISTAVGTNGGMDIASPGLLP